MAAPALPARYRAVRQLGVGGMGEVWQVEDTLASGDVPREQALKIVHPGALKEATPGAFESEFRILASLQHPHLARVFEFGRLADDRAFYTAELVPGVPLSQLAGKATVAQACQILAALCRVLDFLGARGLVHNDVKPSNILVGTLPDEVKLVDFGLASPRRGRAALIGTPVYMAPERLRGEPHDQRADLYSLGATMYRVLTGRTPVDDDRPTRLLAKLEAGFPPADALRIDCPPALARVLASLLAIEPRQRPARGAEVLVMLTTGGLGDFPLETARTGAAYALASLFVGRQQELAEILDAAEQAALGKGGPRLLLLCGPVGSGKSRLLAEARLRLLLSGTAVVLARAAPEPSPFSLAADLLRQALAAGGLPPDEADRGVLATLLADPTADGAPGPHTGAMAELAGEAVRSRLADAAGRALAATASPRPLVVMIEDLHRADEGSAIALGAALAAAAAAEPPVPLLVVASLRDTDRKAPVDRHLGGWNAAGYTRPLPLGPLGRPDLQRLLDSLFGAGVFDQAAAERLLDRSAGSPFVIEEMMRSLLRRGALHATARGWVLDADADEISRELTPTLAALLGDRAAALGADERTLAAALAVLGGPVAPALAVALSGLPDLRAAAALGALDRGGLIVRPADVRDKIALFHEAFGEVLLAALPERDRRAWHAEAARRLEASGTADAVVAHHYLAADLAIPGFAVALRAGRRALELGDSLSATALLQGAARLAAAANPSLDEQRALGEGLGDALAPHEGAGPALAAYERALALHPAGSAAHARLACKAANACMSSGRFDEAERWLALAPEMPFTDGLAPEVEGVRFLMTLYRGRHEDACALARRRLAELERLPPRAGITALRAQLELNLANAIHEEGRFDEARTHAESAHRAASEIGDLRRQSGAENMLGLVTLSNGKLEEAVAHFRRATVLSERIGHHANAALMGANLAETYLWRGETAQADETIGRAIDRLRAMQGGVRGLEWAQGFVRMQQGRPDEAREIFGAILDDTSAAVPKWVEVKAAVGQAVLAWQAGDQATLTLCAAQAAQAAQASGGPFDRIEAAVATALAQAAQGEPDRAFAILDEADARAASGSPTRAAALCLVRAELLLHLGRGAAAREAFGRAAHAFALIGSPLLASRCDNRARELTLPTTRDPEMIATEILSRCPEAARQIAASHHRPTILAALADSAARVLEGRVLVITEDGHGRALAATHGKTAATLGSPGMALRLDGLGPDNVRTGADWLVACGDAGASQRVLLYVETTVAGVAAQGAAQLLVTQAVIALRGATLAESLRTVQRGDGPRPADLTRATLNSRLSGAPPLELTVGLPELASRGRKKSMVGRSRSIQDVFTLVRRVARQRLPVLVLGETGTGKELIARAIHAASRRAAGPFVAVNCAAIPGSLFESELFGHVRGAFTGADRPRRGMFEQADGGTLFLDEMGEMDRNLQAKLLRVLDDGLVRPLGASAAVSVDVRVLAATNRDLSGEVKAGRFRQDLYYRLAALEIALPPLRERRGDVRLLAERLLADIDAEIGDEAGLSPRAPTAGPRLGEQALAVLEAYDWPGNVRELENEMRRARVLAGERPIGARHLSSRVRGDGGPADTRKTGESLADAERSAILRALERVGGNKLKAAKLLGVSREGLRAKMNRHGMLGRA